MKDLIIFDMDGVLVEVTASYRAAIQATVHHYTGYSPLNDEIQEWKNRGGYNDDWKLSHELILARGVSVDFPTVVDRFQQLFLGDGTNGLILREEWVAQPGLFDRLRATYHLAVFTGRFYEEAMLTANRFAPGLFPLVIGADNVTQTKPHPEGIFKIREAVQHTNCWYIGDTVDDARAGRAAGVPFIGIAAPSNPRHAEVVALLRAEGAIAVLDDINSLEAVLGSNR